MAAENWKIYFKNEEVEVLYRYSDCHDEVNGMHQQKILLKFVNLSAKDTEISFSEDLVYNGSTASSGDVKSYRIELKPNETKEGVCSGKDRALYIFSKQLNV